MPVKKRGRIKRKGCILNKKKLIMNFIFSCFRYEQIFALEQRRKKSKDVQNVRGKNQKKEPLTYTPQHTHTNTYVPRTVPSTSTEKRCPITEKAYSQ